MKKTSKLFGALALSAALAMGVTPAFAANAGSNEGSTSEDKTVSTISADGTGTVNADDSGNSTVVNVSTYISQLSVTVPLKLPVVLDRAGSYGKTPNNYYIQNNSGPDIKVTKVDYKILEGSTEEWNFSTTGTHFTGANVKAIAISGGSTMPKIGTMMLSFKPTNSSFGTTTVFTSGASDNNQAGSVESVNWTIPGSASRPDSGSSANSARKMAITVQASSSVLAGDLTTDDEGYADGVAGITYTVAPVTTATA